MTRPVITQAMINAYDEYTHLTLDRRGFMEKLTKLAGSGAAAAAIAPLLAADPAAAEIVPADDARLKGEDINWPGSGGDMMGYLVRPAALAGRLPTVIVIHENRGLNDHIRDVARRVALAGFSAVAPDFLSPSGGTPPDENQARDMIGKLDLAATVADGRALIDWLSSTGGGGRKVGAVGFCWGGGMTNRLAVAAGSNLKAAVPFYGPAPDPSEAPKVEAALLIHLAGNDTRVNSTALPWAEALKAAGKDVTSHVYPGVEHAFHNDTATERYNRAAAQLAWDRTIEFFKARLGA